MDYSFFIYVMHYAPVHLSLFPGKRFIAPYRWSIPWRSLILDIIFDYCYPTIITGILNTLHYYYAVENTTGHQSVDL